MTDTISFIAAEGANECTVISLEEHLNIRCADIAPDEPYLLANADGLSLIADGHALRGDFSRMAARIKRTGVGSELLIKAAKIKDSAGDLTAIDATAGMGDDSFLLAAAGFHVDMYERNPIIFELLSDTVRRAADTPETAKIAANMRVHFGDSITAMRELESGYDVILLDPMFPAKQKSSLAKKKLQMIQHLESPCADEEEMFSAAVGAKPKKLVVKRPPKGAYLAGHKPDYSIKGKAVRFDVYMGR